MLMGMSLVLQVLSPTPKYWTNKKSDLVMALKETLVTEVITDHPEWDMNLCTKFHGNPFGSCQKISLKT